MAQLGDVSKGVRSLPWLRPTMAGDAISRHALEEMPDYRPFDSSVRFALQALPLALIAISITVTHARPLDRWLPRRLCSMLNVLAPLIKDEDLQDTRIGPLSKPNGRLRRGAIFPEDSDSKQYSNIGFARQRRRVLHFLALALLEATSASSRFGWTIDRKGLWSSQSAGCLAVTLAWIFVLVDTWQHRPQTAPVFTVVVVTALFVDACVRSLDFVPLVAQRHYGAFLRAASPAIVDSLVSIACIAIIFAMPVNEGGYEAQVPLRERKRLERGEIVEETEDIKRDYELCPTTPEDYTSLASSLTYTWMEPMQRLSLRRPLLPSDIWRLRSINDTHLLSSRFASSRKTSSGKARSLARRLLICNANDIALDMTYKLSAVTLAYAGPALMKAILQCISDAADQDANLSGRAKNSITSEELTWSPRSKAFVLAIMALAFTLIRYVAELKNFHHARQVGLRVRSTLVIELFEKALKRRIVSSADEGAISVDNAKTAPGGGASSPQSQQKEASRSESPPSESTPLLGDKMKSKTTDKRQYGSSTVPEREKTTPADVGKLVNMMASDINVLLRLGCDCHQLYGAPLEAIIATVFLYRLLGYAALVGLSVLILGLPFNYFVGRVNFRAQRSWREATDKRISLVAELINAVRFVKIQGTQSRWIERVMDARQTEMRRLIWARAYQYSFILIWAGIPIASTVLMFYFYIVVEGNPLTIPVAFTTLTLSLMLRNPLNVIPAFASSLLQGLVSIRRLEAFLAEGEIEELVSLLKREDVGANQRKQPSRALKMEGASFSWQADQPDTTHDTSSRVLALEDVSIDVPDEGLCVIEGPTASGKSSLLAAMLGELERTSGTQSIPKFDEAGHSQISFAAQTPWLEAGKSVRDNIVFVTAWDKERYASVVQACALQEDFAMFADGDMTRISRETLSGGQKARISLARALYHRGHTVLLDDVLSAVDTKVQRHIYEYGLTGTIAQGRRIILATHHVSLVLPRTAYLIRLSNGRVVATGAPSVLRESGMLPDEDSGSGSSSSSASQDGGDAKEESVQMSANSDSQSSDRPNDTDAKDKTTSRLLYDLEARQEGNVRWRSYMLYLQAAPVVIWIVILALGIVLRLNAASEQYWLKLWGEAYKAPAWKLPPAAGHEVFYIAIYGLIGVNTTLLIGLRSVAFWIASYIASKRLYRKLLLSVVHARMRFFDRNPTGRILQRFNLDIGVVDSELPQNAMNFVSNALAFITSALICIVIVPAFSIPVVLGALFAVWGIRGFLKTTMYMQRIESTSTSPMYTAFTQIIEGLMTVRAYGSEAYFLDRMQTITSITSAQWWAICTIEVWLSFRAQMISGLSVFLATALALSGAVSPGSAGMVISSSSLLTTIAYGLSSDYKVLSNNGNSVERIKEYMETEQEAPQTVLGMPVPAAWPTSSGSIEVQNLYIRYDEDLPEVLHGISFSIQPREKIAVVGRTGSGKTSLVSALMRSVEPSSEKSAVIIDGIDIMKIGLEYRKRISVVPQDPILFSGTIRQNLDPFDEKTDEECQWALDRVGINRHLKPDGSSGDAKQSSIIGTTRHEPVTLWTAVASGSSNLSAGQAQLICLARALLRDARIVILDEATSSTDFETDSNIQRAIREMRDSIIIAVAHRLSTVIDYDRILVMERGNIVEYDTPNALLSKDADDASAHFKRMCREAGPATYTRLCEAAGAEP